MAADELVEGGVATGDVGNGVRQRFDVEALLSSDNPREQPNASPRDCSTWLAVFFGLSMSWSGQRAPSPSCLGAVLLKARPRFFPNPVLAFE